MSSSAKKNVIILTPGLSGSSVLTSLIARAGYWTGDDTVKKKDYDTHENRELVRLNTTLFKEANYRGNYTMEFSGEAIKHIASVYGKIDNAPYYAFLRKCDSHRPWIWKDPRLWLTIRFWKNLMDLDDYKFILLTRGNLQIWVSATLRRQIQTYAYSKNYNERIIESLLWFFQENRLPYLHLCYEELILHPEEAIAKLNAHLDVNLTVEDLRQVYTKPLYRNPRSFVDLPKAVLIYLKNFPKRYR